MMPPAAHATYDKSVFFSALVCFLPSIDCDAHWLFDDDDIRSICHSFIHSFILCVSFIHSFILCVCHSFIHSCIHSFCVCHSFIRRSSTGCFSLGVSFILLVSFIHSFIHSVFHSFHSCVSFIQLTQEYSAVNS